MIFERQVFTLHFLQIKYMWDVNYDCMPQTFVNWDEQRNKFTFEEEKKKYGSEKSKEVAGSNNVVLPHNF